MKHRGVFTKAVLALLLAIGTANAGGFPTLDKIKSGTGRFKAVLNGQAILDKETGLVWEKAPSATAVQWDDANYNCTLLKTGNRMGWRVPTVEEALSLFIVSGSTVKLPTDHPFQNLTGDYFWTNSRVAAPGQQFVWAIGPTDGSHAFESPTASLHSTQAWCVRRAGIQCRSVRHDALTAC